MSGARTRAVVSGGSGFLGAHLVEALAAIPRYSEIVLIDRDRSRSVANVDDGKIRRHFYDGSLSSLSAIYEPECLHDTWHLATHFVADHSAKDLDNMLSANIVLACQLAEASLAAPGCYVNCGSLWQYSSDEQPPRTLYATMKTSADQILEYYSRHRSLACVTLILADSYGPGDKRGKLLSAILNSVDESAPLKLTAGAQPFRLTHVEDIVRGLLLAPDVARKGENQHFTLMTQSEHSVRTVVERVLELSPQRLFVELGARPYRSGDILQLPASLPPLLPGWSERVSLDDGLAAMMAEPI